MKAVYIKGDGIKKELRSSVNIQEPPLGTEDLEIRLLLPQLYNKGKVRNLIKKAADHEHPYKDANYFGIEVLDSHVASPGTLYRIKVSYYHGEKPLNMDR